MDLFNHWFKQIIKKVIDFETTILIIRINMYLRWMVRNNDTGVDFGLWKQIKPSQLLMPLDVHVDRVGRRYGLITRKQTDWKTVLELTKNLRKIDPDDPVKFDFALFGIGVLEKDNFG